MKYLRTLYIDKEQIACTKTTMLRGNFEAILLELELFVLFRCKEEHLN
jgi:hypothetical protein